MNWYISNIVNSNETILDKVVSNIVFKQENSKAKFFIDGYIVPRLVIYANYNSLSQYQLVDKLYLKYGLGFIHYIKGVFNIVVLTDNRFYIFNDRHGIKKIFIYKSNEIFYISNALNSISEKFNLSLNKENAAVFSLISHFIDGATLFNEVKTSTPAMQLNWDGRNLFENSYWKPSKIILNRKFEKLTIENHAVKWKEIIANYIDFLKPKHVSITLTGGNDSRMVLAALLTITDKIHSFNFGNPLSHDVKIAKLISSKLDLSFNNYFVKNPDLSWFTNQANNLISEGNSMINIHRAHRNDAMQLEHINFPDSDMILTGLVGGEYIKEPNYNDMNIPSLFLKLLKSKDKNESINIINNELKLKGLNVKEIDSEKVLEIFHAFLKHADFLTEKEKKFIYSYLFYGCSHHVQDSFVFAKNLKRVVNPFMDIDFLEILANSKYWYINRKTNIFSRLNHSFYLVKITDILAPSLSQIPYAKRSEYTAEDMLNHKARFFIKQGFSIFNSKKNLYPSNFPMGKWLYDFCERELKVLPVEIKNIFSIEMLINSLEELKGEERESKWHIITNPINLGLIYKYYGKD